MEVLFFQMEILFFRRQKICKLIKKRYNCLIRERNQYETRGFYKLQTLSNRPAYSPFLLEKLVACINDKNKNLKI